MLTQLNMFYQKQTTNYPNSKTCWVGLISSKIMNTKIPNSRNAMVIVAVRATPTFGFYWSTTLVSSWLPTKQEDIFALHLDAASHIIRTRICHFLDFRRTKTGKSIICYFHIM